MNGYFVVVSFRDSPMYELGVGPNAARVLVAASSAVSSPASSAAMANPTIQEYRKDDQRHLHQFILHSALDVVEEIMWTGSAMYFKAIDKFAEYFVSAYVCANNTKFMLLHDNRNDDGIKAFFQDVYEAYVKILLNPFHDPDGVITSKLFDTKIRALAKRHFG